MKEKTVSERVRYRQRSYKRNDPSSSPTLWSSWPHDGVDGRAKKKKHLEYQTLPAAHNNINFCAAAIIRFTPWSICLAFTRKKSHMRRFPSSLSHLLNHNILIGARLPIGRQISHNWAPYMMFVPLETWPCWWKVFFVGHILTAIVQSWLITLLIYLFIFFQI